ncbi:MAG: GlxA family transcriptional regulator [Rhodobacteraceae bacterium]|nr:GlxA family transcriptional regulator [Paracoccaceae bacterium]
MACLTSMIEPLRAANEIAGRQAFAWRIFSEDGARVEASAGVVFEPHGGLAAAEDIAWLFLLSSPVRSLNPEAGGKDRLRHLARHGTAIGAISGGVFPLARMGLLDGYRCSVHWCYHAAFIAEFPEIAAEDDVIVLDRNRLTASGAAAAFDLTLHFIEDRLGASIATEVACWFQHPLVRGQGVRQTIPTANRGSVGETLPRAVAAAIEIFEKNINNPIELTVMTDKIGLSMRQLERQFKLATGKSPSRYYRSLRMRAARQLVLYSRDSITQIAAAVGYDTATTLTRHYRDEFGIAPLEERREVNRFRVNGNRPLPSI